MVVEWLEEEQEQDFCCKFEFNKKKKKINEIPGMDGEKERINSINSEKKRV